jgi:hypothetical protein
MTQHWHTELDDDDLKFGQAPKRPTMRVLIDTRARKVLMLSGASDEYGESHLGAASLFLRIHEHDLTAENAGHLIGGIIDPKERQIDGVLMSTSLDSVVPVSQKTREIAKLILYDYLYRSKIVASHRWSISIEDAYDTRRKAA